MSHQTPDLPEQLLAGREGIYFRYFLDRDTFRDADVACYGPSSCCAQLACNLRDIPAFPANEKFNAVQRSAIGVPLVLASGENSPFEKLMPSLPQVCGLMGAQTSRSRWLRTAWITL
jgi:hypothetical protein